VKEFRLVSNIKDLLLGMDIPERNRNPHWLARETGLTYRIVLNLYNSETIPYTTQMGTLLAIAQVLGVTVDDLYTIEEVD
jgi:hypothetical protein